MIATSKRPGAPPDNVRPWGLEMLGLLFACVGLGESGGDPTGPGADPDGFPPVEELPPTEGTIVLEWQSDVRNGAVIDLAWAERSGVACFPANLNSYFSGAHVFQEVDLPPLKELVVDLLPAQSADLSLYAYAVSAGGAVVYPPDVASVGACEASPDGAPFNGAGVLESVRLWRGDYDSVVVIGVAGADGATSGKFTLRAELVDP